jgi:hypothetical protein
VRGVGNRDEERDGQGERGNEGQGLSLR